MIRGNGSAMARALRNVRRVVDELGRLPRKLASAAAPDITRELHKQFRHGLDPYGKPWRPLKPSTLRQHGPPPLTYRGNLSGGTVARPMAGNRIGLVITLGARYGAFHQVGFHVGRTLVPPRKILPSRGMPSTWRAALNRRARELSEIAKGAR